jgi:hypothetical protein
MFSALPTGSFRVIYADPPRSFKTGSDKGKGRSAEKHYPSMPLDDIKAMPVDGQGLRTPSVGHIPATTGCDRRNRGVGLQVFDGRSVG